MSAATDPIRRVADRYDLTSLLGRGGAGTVYRAWDTSLERWVAVKVIEADPDDRATARRRTEGRLLASVNHPSLVTLFDAVAAPEATYLVMELVEGGTLRDRIRSAALDPQDAAAIASDVADGLAFVHARGIVHRDVKPANVLLQPQSGTHALAAKLSDFGIATLLETSPGAASGVLGTAHYLSPEQAHGDTVGPASDVYSLGLTLLEALTGRMPFPGTVAESLTARLVRDPEVPGVLGYEWRSLLTAMTSREPAARPSARDVAERAKRLPLEGQPVMLATAPLPTAVASIETSSSVTTPIRPVDPAPRRGRLVSAAVGVTVLAAASIIGLAIGAPSPAAAPTQSTGTAPSRTAPPPSPTVTAAARTTPAAVASADPTPSGTARGTAPAASVRSSQPSTAKSSKGHSGGSAAHAKDESKKSKGKSGR